MLWCVAGQVMDALKMDWPDNSFDLVWACESGEHMPDKKLYVQEMTRVLKPGALLDVPCPLTLQCPGCRCPSSRVHASSHLRPTREDHGAPSLHCGRGRRLASPGVKLQRRGPQAAPW